jgi:hypothetical protein
MHRPQHFHAATHALSRRTFLGSAAVAAGAPWLHSTARGSTDENLAIPPDQQPSRVVEVRSAHVVNGAQVHARLLRDMAAKALTTLTGSKTIEQAWHTILKPDDVVCLKFNQSGQALLRTAEPFAEVLIESLIAAGFAPDRIVCVEAPSNLAAQYGTTEPASGFANVATDFRSGSDELASVLDQVTAIVSIPFLKTHNIAGMTGVLKNLSHGLVKHPARYHANGCSPYIADIVSLPQIREKLRLCLVNALRVVFDKGPEGRIETVSDEGVVFAATDPVAADAYGLGILNEIRRSKQLAPIAPAAQAVAYLRAAHLRRLGIAVAQGIQVIQAPP